MKPEILIFLFLLTGSFLHAQDLTYLKNAVSPMQVKVYEIGLNDVTYAPSDDTIHSVLTMPKENISKLILVNGQILEFKDVAIDNPSNYVNQHNQAIKFNFLSPLFTNLAFSYERSIKPGRSIEAGIGIIGPGKKYQDYNVKGGYVRLGYKFIKSPDKNLDEMEYDHILKGGYIKPELVFGGYGIDRYNSYSTYTNNNYYNTTMHYDWYRRQVTFGAVIINFGKQWVIDDLLVFDFYMGLGYAFSRYTSNPVLRTYYYDENDAEIYHYAFLGGSKDFPVAITAGFKVGIAFGKHKAKSYK